MHWPWSRQPVCRICGRPMSVEWVRYSAPDGEGHWRTWVGVRRYFCPEGCNTGFYDFKRARIAGAAGQGATAGGSRLQAAAWALAWLYTVGGLGLMYALFMYGVALVPAPAGWVRPVLWLLVTAGFAALAMLLAAPSRHAPAGRAPAEAGARPASVSDVARAGGAALAPASGAAGGAGSARGRASASGPTAAASPAGRAAGPGDPGGRSA